MLTLLLERQTHDSVEEAIGFLKECGLKLTQLSPRGTSAIFEHLRDILRLDLAEGDDQFTHMLPLEDDYDPEDVLNIFKMDADFMENEEKYEA
ncbi:Pre-mRNA-splicing factor CWC22-like protein [Microtus ochrogaster]|uniref:Pre-mRNA-splicing factor CWC22-like protein n=1 Tax=Microtus ochrogaster TaxID=79684 RepID=A0A8J6G8T1_MICOH|nr:Pre-mRNA-splicing factor CWC22-like protein [Microtus ochrogaster]